jgi:hypothetical protein
MGNAGSLNGARRYAYRILAGKPEGERPLGREIREWVNNIVVCLLVTQQ